mmetsp:Transcript_20060/g.80353  ORF Transcript_20060/g.80353 Transcript_20060/m.80353 type:complete len:216 (-) Transcript_20060:3594-4241(-)
MKLLLAWAQFQDFLCWKLLVGRVSIGSTVPGIVIFIDLDFCPLAGPASSTSVTAISPAGSKSFWIRCLSFRIRFLFASILRASLTVSSSCRSSPFDLLYWASSCFFLSNSYSISYGFKTMAEQCLAKAPVGAGCLAFCRLSKIFLATLKYRSFSSSIDLGLNFGGHRSLITTNRRSYSMHILNSSSVSSLVQGSNPFGSFSLFFGNGWKLLSIDL